MIPKIFFAAVLFSLAGFTPPAAVAVNQSVTESGTLNQNTIVRIEAFDQRKDILRNYLKSKQSPLAEYAHVFVREADINNLDWRLVVAISGVESSFGKRIPPGSYNAYGWRGGKHYFNSWEESIKIVSRTLNEKYYGKGVVTIEQIGKKYAPPSTTWARNVRFFMHKIDPTPIEFDH